jgi:hypothetical protein
MTFFEWAVSAGLSMEQIRSYQTHLGTYDERLTDGEGASEASVLARCKVRASKMGGRLWRNNKGAAYLQDGTFLRYGILNDSKRISDEIKSSDLIGGYPLLITPAMVGTTVCQLWLVECKKEDWHFGADDHDNAQLKFLELGLAMGARATFATSEDDI